MRIFPVVDLEISSDGALHLAQISVPRNDSRREMPAMIQYEGFISVEVRDHLLLMVLVRPRSVIDRNGRCEGRSQSFAERRAARYRGR